MSVAEETCEQCGFRAGLWSVDAAVAELRLLGDRWAGLLGGATDGDLRVRSTPDTWSVVEYTAHTAGIVRCWREMIVDLLDGRAVVMTEDTYPDPAKMALAGRSAGDIAAELSREAAALAALAERVHDGEWELPLRVVDQSVERGFHAWGVTSVRASLLHALHDALHHLDDVRALLAALRASVPPQERLEADGA